MKLTDLTGTHSQDYVKMILDAGYKVYMREPIDQHCFVTDGTHIGYCQWSGFIHYTTTVHLPNTKVGTGFSVSSVISKNSVEAAMFTFCPHWVNTNDREQVTKYRNWEHYQNASDWNRILKEVTE